MICNQYNLRNDDTSVILQSYILDDSVEMLNGMARPAVLICPGGGYLMCSDREAEPIALRFNAMGYHAFVLRYSVYYKEGEEIVYDKHLIGRENSGYPRAIQDVGFAFACIHTHADEWKVDTDKIVICGFSGGAINCALYGVYWNKSLVKDALCVDKGYAPAGMILGYGVYDNRKKNKQDNILSYSDLDAAYTVALMGSEEPDEKMQRNCSAMLLVDEEVPPTFLWATYEDDAVPIRNTLEMAVALEKKHIPIEVHIYETGFHGLALATQATSPAKDCIVPSVAKWIEAVENWMARRFALQIPDKMVW